VALITLLLLLLTFVSWCYWIFAWWCVRAFFRNPQAADPDFCPPVSILKPVKGLDPQAYENFLTFVHQNYPEFEILFGVLDADDPTVPIIERLQQKFSEPSIRLIIAGPLGTNPKVSILHRLVIEAHYEILAISDSDMRVTPDYLSRVVAPLASPKTGLVTCLYKGGEPLNLTARLEALYVGGLFLPSVLVGRRYLAGRFALGATLVLRRSDLISVGGFAAIADYLADDYELGARIGAQGRRVHLSDYILTTILGAESLRQFWDRQIRWAKCARVSRWREYPGFLITFSTPLAMATATASRLAPWGVATVVTSITLRWGVAWLVSGQTDDRVLRRSLLWLPLSDLFVFFIWCAGGMGRGVVWRGQRFELTSDGRLRIAQPIPLEEATESREGFERTMR
jgi:ceramide glucosyltransferase